MLAFPNIIHSIPPLKKHILSTHSIVVLPALLLISLLLLALPVALLGLEVFLPQLTRRIAVKVGLERGWTSENEFPGTWFIIITYR